LRSERYAAIRRPHGSGNASHGRLDVCSKDQRLAEVGQADEACACNCGMFELRIIPVNILLKTRFR